MDTTFKLDQFAKDPGKAAALSLEVALALLTHCSVVQSALMGRLIALLMAGQPQRAAEERLLSVAEAADKLGLSKDWLYRHADQFPFTVRVGSRHLRFSAQGVDRYIRDQAASRDF